MPTSTTLVSSSLDIRSSSVHELEGIGALYRAAFPGVDLASLLDELLANRDDVLSLVATAGNTLVGHIAFTACGVAGRETRVSLLGPLAVLPERQRHGFGAALIREGLRRLRDYGVARVLVLGDPNYYGRFGFATETAIAPPYPLVPEWQSAWQSLALHPDSAALAGNLIVPAPWMRASLWSP